MAVTGQGPPTLSRRAPVSCDRGGLTSSAGLIAESVTASMPVRRASREKALSNTAAQLKELERRVHGPESALKGSVKPRSSELEGSLDSRSSGKDIELPMIHGRGVKTARSRRQGAGQAHRGANDERGDSISHMIWNGPEYPRVSPGRYLAIACRTQGPEWVTGYHRRSLIVEFELLGEPTRVCAFFNMGSDPDKPKIGRQSRYYRAWTIANGDHPRKGQVMSPDVFLDGQVFEIEVSNCDVDSEGRPKTDAEIYSRVTKVLSATLPEHVSTRKQESRIHQSRNQPIK